MEIVTERCNYCQKVVSKKGGKERNYPYLFASARRFACASDWMSTIRSQIIKDSSGPVMKSGASWHGEDQKWLESGLEMWKQTE